MFTENVLSEKANDELNLQSSENFDEHMAEFDDCASDKQNVNKNSNFLDNELFEGEEELT